jgi:voltage-gated potassium channel
MKKIAIFGYNRISYEVMSRLDKNVYEVLLVETDQTRTALASQNGFDAVSIDFRSDDDLREIGIGQNIDVIFCFLPEDGDNVFLILSARAIDEKIFIITLIENSTSTEKLLAAGANKIIDPYEICGKKIYELIKKPDMTHILDHTVFGRHDLNMAEIEIKSGSCLENSYIGDLNINETYNLILIGIVDKSLGNDLHFSISEKQHQLKSGDILVVMGPTREIKAFKKEVSHV